MNTNEARALVPEFRAATAIVYRQRRRLLRFVHAHWGYLKDAWFRDKAARGYLRDLSNMQLANAVQEIVDAKGGETNNEG